MKENNIGFIAAVFAAFVAFVGGFGLGTMISERIAPQILDILEPPEQSQELASLEDQAESALDDIRTLYQGMTVLASWYGSESGTVTANGEHYDPMRFTAAHRTLPFDSFVIVENTANGRLAIARINDRGPNRRLHRREIDLSYGVARELDMVEEGLAMVRMWAIRIPTGEMAIGRPSIQD